jgi:predicted PurR-regulated permease PerM
MLSVLAMGTLFGVVGVVLSGPLTVAAIVLIRSLYLEGALGEDLESAKGI